MRDHNIDRCYFFECAITTGRQLFLLGWIDDTDLPLTRVIVEGLDGKRRSYAVNEVGRRQQVPAHAASRCA